MTAPVLRPRPPLWRRFFGFIGWLISGSRRLVVNLLWLAFLGLLLWLWLRPGLAPLAERTTLVLDLSGPIVEQKAAPSRDASLLQLGLGSPRMQKVVLRDAVAAIDQATLDPQIVQAVLLLDELQGGSIPALRELGAALQRFQAAGKRVVAWGNGYDQRALYLASHAQQVWLHPMGNVALEGFGRQRSYFRGLLDRLGLEPHVIQAGRYKNFGEPFSLSGPSPATVEADRALYDDLWRQWTADVERLRKLEAGAIAAGIEALPGSLQAVEGDIAKLALQSRLVDALKTRDELRAELIRTGAARDEGRQLRQIRWSDYLAHVPAAARGADPTVRDAVGIVVAEGSISEGIEPPGRVGGLSTAALLQRAREDDRIRAVVLRVNSPGGSPLGSELIRREVELTRAAGKPVVVSMGGVAASGGYWIGMGADEVIADPATITGSIGVVALVLSANGALDRLGVERAGHTTTWIGQAFDPLSGLQPRALQLIETSIGHVYRDFIGRAARARNMTPQALDEVAQGRVWTGAQALDRRLVDRHGGLGDAVKAAATRAQLADGAPIRYIETTPGRVQRLFELFEQQALGAAAQAAWDAWQGDAAASSPMASLPAGLGAALWLASPADRDEWTWWAQQAIETRQGQPWQVEAHCLCAAP